MQGHARTPAHGAGVAVQRRGLVCERLRVEGIVAIDRFVVEFVSRAGIGALAGSFHLSPYEFRKLIGIGGPLR